MKYYAFVRSTLIVIGIVEIWWRITDLSWFVHGYTKCVFHGEGFSSRNTLHPTNDDETFGRQDSIDKLLQDTFRNVADDPRHEGLRGTI